MSAMSKSTAAGSDDGESISAGPGVGVGGTGIEEVGAVGGIGGEGTGTDVGKEGTEDNWAS